MGLIIEEVKEWNSPLIGAFLLWRFTQGYCENHPNGEAPIALNHFLASGILTDYNMVKLISNRRANLQAYIRSFEDSKKTDILLGLQHKISKRKKYTLDAIEIAVSSGLLVWELSEAKLYPKDVTKTLKRGYNIKPSMKIYGNKAEILGKWFSAHDISTVAAYLEVIL